MTDHADPLAPAVHTAHAWIRSVAAGLGTDDRGFAHRALRAWLHAVRDRVGAATLAHLSAQLPVVLRGILFEGWTPDRAPAGHDVASFIGHFAAAAGVSGDEAVALAGAVTEALTDLFSPGQLEHVFAVLPADLRRVLRGTDLDGTLEPDADRAAIR
ncbi:DUF2267 domain-containing protein [Nocardia wallacei]|uniref:DUF2267 domain-containing protein n=1 Tax=Nocardia wallacei TaxID=480035 RepID=UPI0024573DB9|nr:DUF2267 domain-containing protein [Nocardia wallacei]